MLTVLHFPVRLLSNQDRGLLRLRRTLILRLQAMQAMQAISPCQFRRHGLQQLAKPD
jgi:hypothetical protein